MLHDQRGGAVIGFVLIVSVLMVGIVVVTKTVLDHHLVIAQQAADYAAEASARNHERYAQILVRRYRTEFHTVVICEVQRDVSGLPVLDPVTQQPMQDCWEEERSRRIWSSQTIADTEWELLRSWRTRAGCGRNQDPETGWVCDGLPTIQTRWLTFDEDAEHVGHATWQWNWRNGVGARVLDVQVIPAAWSVTTWSARVYVRVHLQISSIWGSVSRGIWIEGTGVPAVPPLLFN